MRGEVLLRAKHAFLLRDRVSSASPALSKGDLLDFPWACLYLASWSIDLLGPLTGKRRLRRPQVGGGSEPTNVRSGSQRAS
jgi:hypothetical protein